MATLQELYIIKRVSEEQGYEYPPRLLQDIQEKELECLERIPHWALNSIPARTEADDYTGPFTVLIEYNNNEIVGAGVRKDYPACDNSYHYVDARETYPELFESPGNEAVE